MEINRLQIYGIIRHALTIVGTYMVLRGHTTYETWVELSGGIMSLLAVMWSIQEKKNK